MVTCYLLEILAFCFCDDISPLVLYFVGNKDISSEHLYEWEYNMNYECVHRDELCSLFYISSRKSSSAFHCLVLNLLIFHS